MEYPQAQMTTAMMKALSHPLRRSILNVFPRRDYVRAADLARELNEPANKISFHLRVLADAGLLVEAPEQARDRRDRVWGPMKGALNIGDAEHPVEDLALGNAVVRQLLADHADLVRRLTTWMPDYLADPGGEAHGTFSRARMKLSPDEFTAMLEAVQAAMKQAWMSAEEAAAAGDGVDRRTYEVDIVALDDRI
mgnify:CR=1 FL=1|jgi:DNA-binding transcriptional ArsR family regulator